MFDAFDNIAKFIQSPPGQLAAGAALAGIVWKFFERVEAVLTDHTKLEIAVWLLDRKKLSPAFQNWPETFAKVFDRVFGRKHFSWQCFLRSAIASLSVAGLVWLFIFGTGFSLLPKAPPPQNASSLGSWDAKVGLSLMILSFGLLNIVPDYLALLATRYSIVLAQRVRGDVKLAAIVIADMVISITIALGPAYLAYNMLFAPIDRAITRIGDKALPDRAHQEAYKKAMARKPIAEAELESVEKDVEANIGYPDAEYWWLFHRFVWLVGLRRTTLGLAVPCCFATIWLWLYAGSGFLLKAARRFDIGFEWFNRHMDIEKKPLQSIGLIAGALVALLYWGVVAFARVV